MTIDQAIEILTNWRKELHEPDKCDAGRAFQLGIEALKRTQEVRPRLYPETIRLLPGETKD